MPPPMKTWLSREKKYSAANTNDEESEPSGSCWRSDAVWWPFGVFSAIVWKWRTFQSGIAVRYTCDSGVFYFGIFWGYSCWRGWAQWSVWYCGNHIPQHETRCHWVWYWRRYHVMPSYYQKAGGTVWLHINDDCWRYSWQGWCRPVPWLWWCETAYYRAVAWMRLVLHSAMSPFVRSAENRWHSWRGALDYSLPSAICSAGRMTCDDGWNGEEEESGEGMWINIETRDFW
jgi:hypothetical protein